MTVPSAQARIASPLQAVISSPLWNMPRRYPNPEDNTPPGTGKQRSGTMGFFLQTADVRVTRGSHTLCSRLSGQDSPGPVRAQSSALNVGPRESPAVVGLGASACTTCRGAQDEGSSFFATPVTEEHDAMNGIRNTTQWKDLQPIPCSKRN
jgi:hypothetical protein